MDPPTPRTSSPSGPSRRSSHGTRTPPATAPRRKGFRLAAHRLFLTYPKNDTPKALLLKRALDKWGEELEWAVVCVEQHKDGTPHLHAVLSFLQKKNFRDPRFADFLGGKHGNYKAVKNLRKSLEYVQKWDKELAEHGISVSEYLATHHASVGAHVESILQSGGGLREIQEARPGYLVNALQRVERYQAWMLAERTRSRATCWDPCHAADADCGQDVEIAEWLNAAILKTRERKSPQLWLYGPPNTGKTALLMWLEEAVRVMWLTHSEQFYDQWHPDTFDLIAIDEFHGQQKLQFLNLLLDGSPMIMPCKGGQRMKATPLPVIVCSNGSPTTCYSRVSSCWTDALLARLIVVNVTTFIKIESQ